ncbi:hypothetical protein HK097_010531 [Rhizophlyctis rosea]|uniref:NAD(P)-binding protein n=1 Tax=Rhizophlyctis rosea TaxID=64517 RepID=A0AAD5S7I6_9FUNG|nr:hypothetical protein HK097_010531 [Rhizophlyctis rosea]
MPAQAFKTILVTGANKGIGFHAARLLSEKLPSTTILLGSRSISNAESALQKLRSSSTNQYTNLIPIQLDVSDAQSVDRAAKDVETKYGSLDVLLNNAGIANDNPKEVFEVNLFGVKRTIEAFEPLLKKVSDPRIVVVSSEVGKGGLDLMTPDLQSTFTNIDSLTWSTISDLAEDYLSSSPTRKWPNPAQTYGSYGVSKTFVSAWSRLYAKQHPEIRLAVVCPGYCQTDLAPQGVRSAEAGGKSVIFPVLEDKWEQGGFYRDAEPLKYIS